MAFVGINQLYIALMSFKYNIVSIYTFMLPWQHHLKAGHLILIVLIFDLYFSIIHDALRQLCDMLISVLDPYVSKLRHLVSIGKTFN